MRITAQALNILLLILLALFWGSAFSFIKIAIATVTPITLAAARITLAALLLALYARLAGYSLPVAAATWRTAAAVGLTGTVIPFGMIAWSENYVASSTAAILMALIPLTTLVLAHFMTENEKISWAKLAGVVIGFSGVFLLYGAGAAVPGRDPVMSALGLGAVLVAVLGYALSGLLAIRFKGVPRAASSAATLISSAVMILPLALIFEHPWTLKPDLAAICATLFLGLFPTALAMVMLITLVERAGATFLSLSNYLVPVFGMLLGALWLGEHIAWQTGIAFLLICLGIYITGRKAAANAPTAAPGKGTSD